MEIMIYCLHYLETGGLVRIFIYHNHFQEALYKSISLGKFPMTRICTSDALISQYNPMDKPILVVISQPSKLLIDEMLSREWHAIFCFIGIRQMKTNRSPVHYFENEFEFHRMIETFVESQKSAIKQMYVDQFDDLTEEDAAYLSKISGISIAGKLLKKDSNKKIKKYEKSGMITVIGNSELAASIANKVSKKSQRLVLIIDGHLLKPSLDEIYRLKNIQTNIKSHLTGADNTGLNIALDTLTKGIDIGDHLEAITKKVSPNLRVLLGNYNFYNYEHYDEKIIKSLLLKLQSHFQFIVLTVSDSPYDSLTMQGIHMSSINIFACGKQMKDIRYNYNLMKVLNAKQGISQLKNLIVSVDSKSLYHKTQTSVSRNIFGKSYLGQMGGNYKNDEKIVDKIVERMTSWD